MAISYSNSIIHQLNGGSGLFSHANSQAKHSELQQRCFNLGTLKVV